MLTRQNLPDFRLRQLNQRLEDYMNRSQYYILKEIKTWAVVAKSTRTGSKNIDDLVLYRGGKTAALKTLAELRKKERLKAYLP